MTEVTTEVYSAETQIRYDSWDDLVAAEGNGYVVVGVTDRPNTVPVVVGPYPDEQEAQKARVRLRRKWKKEEAELGFTARTHVRVCWKEKV